jgi:hypothetical protein
MRPLPSGPSPRFSKGTTDHDNDGRMGGSLKGDGTMAAKKKPAAKAAAETKPAANPVAAPRAARREALDAEFAKADAKGEPEEKPADAAKAEEARVRNQVTGL